MAKLKCKCCDNEFLHYDKRTVFCSKECYKKGRIKLKKCQICGLEYGGRNSAGKRFCSSKCYGEYRKINYSGNNHNSWKGGITYSNGYRYIYSPNNPNANHVGYVMEHRLVMEDKIGRFLDLKNEVVHHINKNRKDNRIENLVLMTRAEHLKHHKDDTHHK